MKKVNWNYSLGEIIVITTVPSIDVCTENAKKINQKYRSQKQLEDMFFGIIIDAINRSAKL